TFDAAWEVSESSSERPSRRPQSLTARTRRRNISVNKAGSNAPHQHGSESSSNPAQDHAVKRPSLATILALKVRTDQFTFACGVRAFKRQPLEQIAHLCSMIFHPGEVVAVIRRNPNAALWHEHSVKLAQERSLDQP